MFQRQLAFSRAILIYALLIFLSAETSGQQSLFFKRYGAEQGLSNNDINCIVQDSSGFIWIGTNDGLNRFDGDEFVVYRNSESDTTSVGGSVITDLFTDKQGVLWIASADGGLSCYNKDTGRFSQFGAQKYPSEHPGKHLLRIHENAQGEFWVAAENSGLYRFDKKSGRFSKEKREPFTRGGKFYTISSDKQATYFGFIGISITRLKGNQINPINTEQPAFPNAGYTTNCQYGDKSGNLWIGAWDNGLHKYSPASETFETVWTLKNERFSFSGDQITAINAEDENLWLGTRSGGVCLFNPSTKAYSFFEHNNASRNSLSSNSIKCIFRDNNKLTWIGTDAGINVYDPLLNQFNWIYPAGSAGKADFNEKVTCILPEKDGILISTVNGLWARTGRNAEFTSHQYTDAGTRLQIFTVYRDSRKRIIIGTNKSAYYLTPDFVPHLFNRFYVKNSYYLEGLNFFDLSASRINAIAETTIQGRPLIILSVVGYGLAIFDRDLLSGWVTQTVKEQSGNYRNSENIINAFSVDEKDKLWLLGQNGGLMKDLGLPTLEPNLRVFEDSPARKKGIILTTLVDCCYVTRVFNAQDFAPRNISDLIKNPDGTFYVSSKDKGLFLFDSKSNKVNPIPSLHHNLQGMRRDKKGRIWIISSGGFDVYFPSTRSWQRIDPSKGLPEKGIHGYIKEDDEGNFYVGSYGCVVNFKPENFRFASSRPEVAFTHLKIFDKSADSLLTRNPVELSFDQNFISLSFTSFDFSGFSNPEFQYMLDGIDKNWVKSGPGKLASYTNLEGGRYRLRIRAFNRPGEFSGEKMITIVIHPPFWKTPAFLICMVLLIAGGVWYIYKRRISQLRRQQHNLLKTEIAAQEKERRRLSQDLHDDLGTRLSTLKLFINSIGKTLLPGSQAKEIQQNAEQLLDESMVDLRTILLNLSPDSLNNYGYLKAVEELAFKIRSAGLLNITFSVTGSPERFDSAKELALFRITQELITNSIKHAEATTISIQILREQQLFSLLYEDNGKGFNKNQKSSGLGLLNITNRLTLFSGKVNWDTSPGNGMRAVIEIPL